MILDSNFRIHGLKQNLHSFVLYDDVILIYKLSGLILFIGSKTLLQLFLHIWWNKVITSQFH